MNIDTVCMLLINALKDAGYNDSYEGLRHSAKNTMLRSITMKSASFMLIL